MSTVLAAISQESEPQLPLLGDIVELHPQTDSQREVQANLQNAIDQVICGIENLELRSITQTILGEMLRFFDWLD